MKRIPVAVATFAGASAIMLSTVASPAFAATTTPIPTETLTNHVTVSEFIHAGVTAKFAHLTPGGSYQLVFAEPGEGGPVGGTLTADSSGHLTAKYVATDPGKKYRADLVGDRYELSLWSGGTTVVSETFAVRLGSEVRFDRAHRSGHELTLRATAKHWVAGTEKFAAWRSATVRFQEKVKGAWHTVKSARTNAEGVAAVTVKTGRHLWRAVVSGTTTVWTTRTGTHKA
ncbi:hypothetical protein [Amnibacterium sp.]|uniref:hypothetical protein n=1 Tax=Amnibacterium sp. TaxID=1872496 RepID=UPI003F7BB662